MNRRSIIIFGLLLFGGVAFVHSHQVSAQTAWTTLFDGTNLNNFTQIGNANWRLEDGAVVADKGNGFLVTKDSYSDFEIRAEFWVNDDANSGIFIRCEDPAKVSGQNAYEVNIFDKRPDPNFGTGAIVNVAKVSPMPKAGGKWNVYEITAKGSQFTVVLNGMKTVDGAQDSKHASGHIALQYGAGAPGTGPGIVKFRKVEIRRL
jgi:3-keto-disaccharide hydrolase